MEKRIKISISFSLFLLVCSLFMVFSGFNPVIDVDDFFKEEVEITKPKSAGGQNYTLDWYKLWGGNGTQTGSRLAMDSLDNIYVTGYTMDGPSGRNDAVLVKFNSSGNQLWNRTWGGVNDDNGRDIAVDSSNNIYITGTYNSHGLTYDWEIFLVKYDQDGNYLWNRTWGELERSCGQAVAIDSSNNIYVGGIGGAILEDIVLIKYNSTGAKLWQRQWGGSHYEGRYGFSLAVDSYDNLYLASQTESFGAGNSDAVLIKYDQVGNQIWNRTWGGSASDGAEGIAIDKNNNIFIGGYTSSFGQSGQQNLFLAKYSSAGNQKWNRTHSAAGNLYCRDLTIDSTGDIFVTGSSWDGMLSSIYFSSFDSLGYQTWSTTWGVGAFIEGYGIALNSLENVFISGYVDYQDGVFDEMILLKYCSNASILLEIIPQFEECYMKDDANFFVKLTDWEGNDLDLPVDIISEKAYWDAHDNTSTSLSNLTVLSGTAFHNESGTPSSSYYLDNGLPAYRILENLTYPYESLIVAPEILEYNPVSNFTRQQVEVYIQLDLSDLIETYNLDPPKDFSFLNATIFGSKFIELPHVEQLNELFGKLEIYNYLTNSYRNLSNDIFEEALVLGSLNNPLTLEDLPDYTFNFTAPEIPKYIDPQNKITFRLSSYFEGILTDPEDTYLSNFEQNAVLGALLDYVKFDVVWWKESPNLVLYNETRDDFVSNNVFTYEPTCPGTYTIYFKVRPSIYYEDPPEGTFTVNVKRRPVNISLDFQSETYTTQGLIVTANVTDQLIDAPAIDVKLDFYSFYNGSDMYLGEASTDFDGIATLELDRIYRGNHLIRAVAKENHGRYSKPFLDEPFKKDYWAQNNSENYPLYINLSQTSLELFSLAPEGENVIVDQGFYIYPKLFDTTTDNEIFYENISIYANSTFIGIFNSSIPFLMSFSKPGQHIIEAYYKGSAYLNYSQTTLTFNVTRLHLSFIDVSPSESFLAPNQQINITVFAKDLTTGLPVSDLNVSLYTNVTGLHANGLTGLDGTITFSFDIPENWASKDVTFWAVNSPEPDIYLQQKTTEFQKSIRPYNTSVLLTINETDLYALEEYEFTFMLWNLDTLEFVDNELINITILKDGFILPDYFNIQVETSVDNTLIFNFSEVGEYKIRANHYESELYMACFNIFNFEILKRPTYVTVDITDQDLVPGYNFSITVELIDTLSNQTISNKFLNVTENIYDNGTLVETKEPFTVKTNFTNTFQWTPLRSADFEFIFSFYDPIFPDDIYQWSNFSVILCVKKRQVLIDTFINGSSFKVGNFIRINSTFSDLNTTNSDPIVDLLVAYVILENESISYSDNFTTDSLGQIIFDWQIPLDFINTSITILIITADTNFYEWNYRQLEISTLPLETFLNITVQPNPHSYINTEIVFEFELISAQGDVIEENISYIITCEEILYYNSGIINLEETSLLTVSFSEAGRYIFKFNYNGSEIYAPTEAEIIYFIDLFHSTLKLIDYPAIIFSAQQTINLTYQLVDSFTQAPISGSIVRLYYINFTTSSQVYLGLEALTDLDGFVNFLADLPDEYDFTSILLIAEAAETAINSGSSNNIEIFITETPTFIKISASTESIQHYINVTSNVTLQLQLVDLFDNLLISEQLSVEIETPGDNLLIIIDCNQSIMLNFTELGLYRVNVTYLGSEYYLPASAQIFYAVSPIPTSLEFIEVIPDTLYRGEFLYLKALLKENITGLPLEGELVKFYISNDTLTSLIYEGLTNHNGFLAYVWEVDGLFIEQNVKIFAVYDYIPDYKYENSSTPKVLTYISKFNVEILLIDFPVILVPQTEETFTLKGLKQPSGDDATDSHLQVFALLPNGTIILIDEGVTNTEGILTFDWTPYRDLFELNSLLFQIYAVENDYYYGGLILSVTVPIDKIQTVLSIIPDEELVTPGEIVLIDFNLLNIYGEQLIGQNIDVSINNALFSSNFTIVIGFNDTYDFLIPNYGTFKIIGSYEGDNRNYPSSNTTFLCSETFELNIVLSILEGFVKNKTCGFLGFHWNYSVLNYNQNFTLIANVTIKNTNIPVEGLVVHFYFLQPYMDPILLGFNNTNNEGIAVFYWDTSNYSMPHWWTSSALIAKIEKSEMYDATESDPVYITLRKIWTYIAIDAFTPKFRIDATYKINISICDEFDIKLKGLPLTVKIFDPDGDLIENYGMISNGSNQIVLTPTQLGWYEIKVFFVGNEQYYCTHNSKSYECIDKGSTSIRIILPEKIVAGFPLNITVELINSTGHLIVGELVKVCFMFHDDSGKTEYFNIEVIMGFNNTFEWIFPIFDEYIIKAVYSGSSDYKGCREFEYPSIFVLFTFKWWELIVFIFTPCIIIFTAKDTKIFKFSKKKKKIAAIACSILILGSMYAEIAFVCSQIETKGLITDVEGNSNYSPSDLFNNPQNQEVFSDIFDYGSSKLKDANSNIDPDLIPDLVNESSPYDSIIENTTVIPPEADKTPPNLRFTNIRGNQNITGTFPVEVDAFDRETGIQKITLKLYHQGYTLVEEGEFMYNNATDTYIYNLSTLNHDDGNYDIYAIGLDNNNNEEKIFESIGIDNYPSFDFKDIEPEYIIAELTDYINISFTAVATVSCNIFIVDLKGNTISSFFRVVGAGESVIEEILIDPIYFSSGAYKIVIQASATIDGIPKTQEEELDLNIIKESVKLELDILEGEKIYTDHYVNFRARLMENDYEVLDIGEPIESEAPLPISGQVLTFKVADTDNHFVLGTVVTDNNGYANFRYKVDLSKGIHIFNVSYRGNNIYKPLEGMHLFENRGNYTFIDVSYTNSFVPYNTMGSIIARLYGDYDVIPAKSLYFNISNSIDNYYLGMAMTDLNGEAEIEFVCDYLPGTYDIIISYDGDYQNADNISIFEDRLEIIRQDVELSIVTGSGSDIICPYNYETEIAAKLLENNTDIGIEGITLNFELIFSNATRYPLNTSVTDVNGLASIAFNPSEYEGIVPDDYYLNVYLENTDYYNGNYDLVGLNISEDIPIVSIQGTEALFFTEFNVNATLTDSLLNPIQGEKLYFFFINGSSPEKTVLFTGNATTNIKGTATLLVLPGQFNYSGTFDIEVIFLGNEILSSFSWLFENTLTILPHETYLTVQGPEMGNVLDPYEIEISLVDSQGTPIFNQRIKIECYKVNGTTNFLTEDTAIYTDRFGKVNFSIYLNIPDFFIIKALYRPLEDSDPTNDGFIASKDDIIFEIKRVSAELSITQLNTPRIMRGNVLKITVEAGLAAAKLYVIPVNFFVDGIGFAHEDIFDGDYRYIKNGKVVISYLIPLGDSFQAGEYNFSVTIDEEYSIFKGTTWVLVDLVERTTISIKYNILNPKAKGKHYIAEMEEMEFTLRDEDGDPIPDYVLDYNGSIKQTNRYLTYQIVNGMQLNSSVELMNSQGKYITNHTPGFYGSQICFAFHVGSRFFAPSQRISKIIINRRPLVLNFIDFWHNNPERPDKPHSGHRYETITVKGRVQDLLSGEYLQGQKVLFLADGKYRRVSGISDSNGYVLMSVQLNRTTGLIQARRYRLSLKIKFTARYQSVVKYSLNTLDVFEVGRFKITGGDISTRDWKFVIKSTIDLLDEDGKKIKNVEFYVRLVDKYSKRLEWDGNFKSGSIPIPVMRGGIYEIIVSMVNKDYAKTADVQLIANNMVPKTLFIAPQKTRYPPLIVFDPVVANVIIPFISNVLYRALDLCVRWEGHIYTYITLLILNIIMGYLGRNLHLTWLNLLMIVVQAFVLGMLGLGNWAYAYLAHLGILSGILLIVGVLSSPDWLRLSIALVVGGIGILYARKGKAANICNKKYAYDKMFTGIDKTLILLELAVLVLGGMIEMVGAAWGPLKHAIGNLPYILWISLHQFRGVVVYLGVGRAILAILITAVVTWIIDELIFSKFPRKGGLFGWIIDIARRAFKVILIVVLYALVSIYFGVAADIFGKALTEMLGNIVIAVILRSVFNFIFEGDFFKEETLYQHLFTPV